MGKKHSFLNVMKVSICHSPLRLPGTGSISKGFLEFCSVTALFWDLQGDEDKSNCAEISVTSLLPRSPTCLNGKTQKQLIGTLKWFRFLPTGANDNENQSLAILAILCPKANIFPHSKARSRALIFFQGQRGICFTLSGNHRLAVSKLLCFL